MMNHNSHNASSSLLVNAPEPKIFFDGAIIVGAGPSGLATAACLKRRGIPFIILERADCIASLWQLRTYDRLKLNLPRRLCQLPYLSFPQHLPDYLAKHEFISYLESYAKHFEINPRFNESVISAEYDETCGLWRVKTVSGLITEYTCRWLVVATGMNAEKIVPEFEGLEGFGGEVMHSCDYKTGKSYQGKNVLVVGCGNSGIDVSLDLAESNANPFMVVRNSGHNLPSEIKIVPAINKFTQGKVEFVNGKVLEIDSVIMATGYTSNVSSWLMESDFFSKEGYPKSPFPNGWKGKAGLYAVGFSELGLLGASSDATKVAQDIAKVWYEQM